MRARRDWAQRSDERGTVTAELACVMPALLLVLALCMSALSLSSRQIRMTDAAAVGARILARGDDPATAERTIHALVPGVRIATETRGEFVCVKLEASGGVGLPGLVRASLASVDAAASGCALTVTTA